MYDDPPTHIHVHKKHQQDPLAAERQVCNLGEAIPGFGTTSPTEGGGNKPENEKGPAGGEGGEKEQEGQRRPRSSSSSQQPAVQEKGVGDDADVPLGGIRHFPWKTLPQTMRVVASRRFAEHMLVKVCSRSGRCLGMGGWRQGKTKTPS